jgi:uncharacterized protein (DUF169 family)
MITLDGLTQQDIQICNLLWNCDSVEAVDRMVAAMPSAYKTRAVVLRELMTAAALDDVMTVDCNVKDYLNSVSR